jgi:tetraacyldisaccharide 4'-kinase
LFVPGFSFFYRQFMLKAPGFWQTDNLTARTMAPLGQLFTFGSRLRGRLIAPAVMTTPVICVGNLVAGGTGKTPVCLALAAMLKGHSKKLCFLGKGYGGRYDGPLLVDPDKHTCAEVGDEALLLAQTAPAWIAKDRKAGALAAAKSGAQIIIMDDGFQNPGVPKALSLVVIDGGYGFGNQRVMPAGPLRETIDEGLRRAHGVILLGNDAFNVGTLIGLKFGLPVLRARLELEPPAPALLKRPLVAFAGIGRPQKFFDSVAAAGGKLVGQESFPDHHTFRDKDILRLSRMAKLQDAALVTTTKDFVRLPAGFHDKVIPLPVKVVWEDARAVMKLLEPFVSA